MSYRSRVGRGLCLLVALTAVLATQSSAFGANAKFRSSNDVSLQANGELRGQVMDQQGRPQALSHVAVVQNNKVIGVAKTDVAGRFVIPGLKPGAYQLHHNTASKSVRVWASQTAPPVAHQAVLLVGEEAAVRANLDHATYGPAIRGAIAGGLITGLTYWGLDYNPSGS